MQPGMLLLEDLTEDVTSLKRVRNRFSRSSDQKLGTIIPALIPKLFQRLERYRMLIINDSEGSFNQSQLDNSTFIILKEAKENINGILANAIERLRGNVNIPVEALASVALPFIDSQSPVVSTWALAFLKVSIQRIPLTNSQLSSSLIPPLLESLGRSQKRLTQATESSLSESPLETHWISVSWILLDCIVHNSGQKPMVDWDIDSLDREQLIHRTRWNSGNGLANEDRCLKSSSLGHDSSKKRSVSREAAQGFVSLLMDLLLYRPGYIPTGEIMVLSPIGERRMQHRNEAFSEQNMTDDDLVVPPLARQHVPDLPPQFRRRATITRWSDASEAYLRYMQLACLEFAISPRGKELFGGWNREYSIVICSLFASHESIHGRIALSHLNKWIAENSSLPLSVAINILAIAVGEDQAEGVIDAFERQHDSGIRGQLLFGTKSNNQCILRPPIDFATSVKAVDFLLENSLDWKGSTSSQCIKSPMDSDDISDELYAKMLIKLSLKLSEGDSDEHKFLSMRLVSNFFGRLERPGKVIVGKIFDLIINMLTKLVDTSMIEQDLRIAPRNNRNTAAQIPVPFNVRNDLNKLLQSHRQSLKRKNLNRDNATQARKEAYAMIPFLSTFVIDLTNASKFQLPILLFRCAGFEDPYLEEYLTKALDSVLVEYKKKFDENGSFVSKGCKDYGMSSQQQTTFLLPALLETVSSKSVNVRMNAIQWVKELLVDMDSEAASCLAAYLLHDENSKIVQIAKTILEGDASTPSLDVIQDEANTMMIDLNSNDGLMRIQNDLKDRSRAIAQKLQISIEESIVLLLQYRFSVAKVEIEYNNNAAACRELCGFCVKQKSNTDGNISDGFDCGICYEGMGYGNTYALHCGHHFCNNCWISYVKEASDQTLLTSFLDLRCPHHACNSRVMPHDLQQLKPRFVSIWNDFVLRKFIEEDTSYRYCPGPDCTCVAVRISKSAAITSNSQNVRCDTCRTSFCFGCGQSEHLPATCRDIKQWNLLKGSSQFWIKQNSKP